VWLPLLFGAGTHNWRAVAEALQPTLLWYLALIGAVRHTHRLLGSGWDPSGHALVYGSQLVPLWHLRCEGMVFDHPLHSCWLLPWTAVLWYLSVMTAVAFHTLSETLAAVCMVTILVYVLSSSHDGDGRIAFAHCAVSFDRSRQIIVAAAAWTAFTAIGWAGATGASDSISGSSSELPLLGAQLGYDTILWLLFCWLLCHLQSTSEHVREDVGLCIPGRRGCQSSSSGVQSVSVTSYAPSAAGSSGLRSREASPSSGGSL
jgi:hypothetical protein